MTLNAYLGNNRSMLVGLFRMGGAVILLTNGRLCDRRRSKYQLIHTNKGVDNHSYSYITQEWDKEGKVGVVLSNRTSKVEPSKLRLRSSVLKMMYLLVDWTD
ncbi:3-ketoacyl-CoA synthase 16-like [Zingiber officinale]|uniref:3-ketoacyl-CoA synthase 16-like n=1 Tax=Zingiber officinale TaxID=94328 RepID=UPI001C4D246E|nr:3-ketoacyl-CoA synthase 16-like [Zingiber officinale]